MILFAENWVREKWEKAVSFHRHPCTHLNYIKPVTTGLKNFLHSYSARWGLSYASIPPLLLKFSPIHLVPPGQEGVWDLGKRSQGEQSPEESWYLPPGSEADCLEVGSFLVEGFGEQGLCGQKKMKGSLVDF